MSAVSTTALRLPAYYPLVQSYRPTGKTLPFKAPDQSRAAKNPALFPLHDQLGHIAILPDNWDGHRSARPHPSSVEAARQFIEDLYLQIQGLETAAWQTPHISASEDGEIVFEWWNGNRKLTIYVGPRELTYVKSWGPHVVNDMEDGVVPDGGMPLLWGWLFE